MRASYLSHLQPGVANPLENMRVLVLRENWLGNTGLSAFNALLRAGVWAESISEGDYIPTEWRHPAMRALGKLVRRSAVAEFNRALLRKMEDVQPHLFVAIKGTFVEPHTLRAMRERGVTCYCFYPDVSLTTHGRYIQDAIREYDWVFTTKSFGIRDLAALGQLNSSFMPHAFDPEVHRHRKPTPELMKRFGCDVSFIGTWSPKKECLLEELVRLRPSLDLKVWGNQWESLATVSPLYGKTMFRPITGIGYPSAIACSKINLGLLSEERPGASSGDLITSRTFHIPACGGLMLHERTADLLNIFKEDDSCVCFSGAKELASKIDRLLRDDHFRMSVAQRGQDVVRAAHSWDHRIRSILQHFFESVAPAARETDN